MPLAVPGVIGAGPMAAARHLGTYECPGEGLAGAAGVDHPPAHLARGKRPVTGPAAAAHVEADACVQQDRQGAPGRDVPTRWRGGAAKAEPAWMSGPAQRGQTHCGPSLS